MKRSLCARSLLGSLLIASLVACQAPPVDVEEELFEIQGQEGNCNADLEVRLDTTPDSLDLERKPCPSACFDVKADKNITHIFVDTGGAEDFDVFVDGDKVDPDRFHDQGGPCNHGETEIEREIWFPLTGNQEEVEVCVVINDGTGNAMKELSYGGESTEINVGAKAACECREADVEVDCEKEPCPPCPPCKKHDGYERARCDLASPRLSEYEECECECPCERY